MPLLSFISSIFVYFVFFPYCYSSFLIPPRCLFPYIYMTFWYSTYVLSGLFTSLSFSSFASVHLHQGISTLLPLPYLKPCFCIPHVFSSLSFHTRSYASTVLGVVILSVCLSVRPSACFVTNPKNLPTIFLCYMKGQSFYTMSQKNIPPLQLAIIFRARAMLALQALY